MATPRQPRTPPSVHQLKVTLRGSTPPIWRRVQAPSDITLGDLHVILQAAMGWWEGHMHQFIVGQTYYGEPGDEEDDWGLTTRDEDGVRLRQVLPREGSKLVYEYDFGDGWEHVVLLEKVLPPEPGAAYPRCIAGRRACPPEDSGGIWGYLHLIEVLADPSHPEHDEMREWAGADFDPKAFSLDEINERLQKRS